jgi:phosphomannomutase/phosphoglucomutase
MSPHCDDDKKYGVVDKITAEIEGLKRAKTKIDGRAIKDINTINGARFTFEDDSWGLLRASSNKPELVVVCESLTSEAQMKSIFRFIEGLLAKHPEVGDFNQKI